MAKKIKNRIYMLVLILFGSMLFTGCVSTKIAEEKLINTMKKEEMPVNQPAKEPETDEGEKQPIEESSAPVVSENPYGEILDMYYNALLQRRNEPYAEFEKFLTEDQIPYCIINPYWTWTLRQEDGPRTADIMSKEGFAYEDLNGDGVDELLIGWIDNECWNLEQGYVFAVYTIVDGRVVLALEGWERNLYVVGADGYLYNSTSSSASEGSTVKYLFDLQQEDFLQPVEGIYGYGEYDRICKKHITNLSEIHGLEDVRNYETELMDMNEALAMEEAWMASGKALNYSTFTEYNR